MKRWVAASVLFPLLILRASSAGAAEGRGVAFAAPDLRAASPGPEWVTLAPVPDAPHLRASFTRESSQITLTFDPFPEPREPSAYVKQVFDILSQPPMSYRAVTRTTFRSRGRAAYRLDYTDATAKRHFSQVAVLLGHGSIAVLTLSSPTARDFEELDLPTLLSFVDGVQVPSGRK